MTTKASYRISIFWEEIGTVNEGGMEGERDIDITRKPTKVDMVKIEIAMRKVLVDVGLITPEKKS